MAKTENSHHCHAKSTKMMKQVIILWKVYFTLIIVLFWPAEDVRSIATF